MMIRGKIIFVLIIALEALVQSENPSSKKFSFEDKIRIKRQTISGKNPPKSSDKPVPPSLSQNKTNDKNSTLGLDKGANLTVNIEKFVPSSVPQNLTDDKNSTKGENKTGADLSVNIEKFVSSSLPQNLTDDKNSTIGKIKIGSVESVSTEKSVNSSLSQNLIHDKNSTLKLYKDFLKKCKGDKCSCSPLVYCSTFYIELLKKGFSCEITEEEYKTNCQTNVTGVELSSDVNSNNPIIGPAIDGRKHIISSEASEKEASEGVESAVQALDKKSEFEKNLLDEGLSVNDPNTPEFEHMKFFSTTPEALEIAKVAFFHESAAASIDGLQLTSEQVKASLKKAKINPRMVCPTTTVCTEEDQLFRRIDGSCNNLLNPDWGKAMTPFERMIIPPNYADNISIPRKSIDGTELPSARKVSRIIATDLDFTSFFHTLLVMQYGQFLDHDITQAPISRFANQSGIQCCELDSSAPLPKAKAHPECFAIVVEKNDPFYSPFNRGCLNFVRSLPAPQSDCSASSYRNQMNTRTHFLDGSAVYGTSQSEANRIRHRTGGLLKTGENDMLPDVPTTSGFDFFAGDSRVNTHPHLSVMHTIFMRQHNRLAKMLSKLNPKWNDERLFQEARRIVIAQIQHITYSEWLRIIIGDQQMKDLGLFPLESGFLNSYTNTLNPNIRNEFAAAAFRFGHSTVQGDLKLFTTKNQVAETLKLENCFNQPISLKAPSSRFGRFLRGLYLQPMQDSDFWVSKALTEMLFKTSSQAFGLDLASFNIQRGRDHGIGTYNQMREVCKLKPVNTFKELKLLVDSRSFASFKRAYKIVQDIDPFIAGLAERPFNGGIVGETFNCIIREQFFRFKFADRFFYENGDLNCSFSEAQLDEIRKTTFAGLFCDNDATVINIQPNPFKLADSRSNAEVPCTSTSIPTINLNPWKEIPEPAPGPL